MHFRIFAALVALIAFGAPALSHKFSVGSIEIGHPWSRPTPPAAPVASGYVKLTNSGSDMDRLVEVRSLISARVEIHRSIVESGIASMRPVDGGVDVPAGATVDFEVEKLHLMFVEPSQQLKYGDRFVATLVFEKAGPVEVEFVVQRKAGESAQQDHSGHGATK